jgi:ribonuclease HI
MAEPAAFTIHIDGAARGNPGPAAYAYVIERHQGPAIEEKGCLGTATNNVAEYYALNQALERAHQLGGTRLLIYSDSELLVKQMNGEYRVRNPELLQLYRKAIELRSRFDLVTILHVRRNENTRADQLCNEALDGKPRVKARAASAKNSTTPGLNPRQEAIREDAIACLRAAAGSWARGNANDPAPEAVWDQLQSILEENGAFPGSRRR